MSLPSESSLLVPVLAASCEDGPLHFQMAALINVLCSGVRSGFDEGTWDLLAQAMASLEPQGFSAAPETTVKLTSEQACRVISEVSQRRSTRYR